MGIKSFTGRREKQPEEKVPLRVRDYMTRNLITFHPDQHVEEVIDLLIRHKISGGPVVNEDRELVGILSEGDCIKHISDSRYYNMPPEQNRVSNCMVRDVETIDGNLNIFDAAKKFLEAKRRRFPIVENGKLAGQISQKDILKATVALRSQRWK
ncbi:MULTISPECIES: CBS domain-containing protein [Robiginitalea]|mgnify:CR=1 FL=1|uniref:CBS domain protein n=1 Tax=Robiginitalea biformata (strain ATCC BAA-864 / DSM 15991 / KCTC 12146 / HTCC2501) TaxID=313596 RepID=A4CKS6_ROBBH|nr:MULTISPECIES: CBS domain-containing protein [Robiginitalea]EAR15475.1 CBS domain protein [Robiginitalea biformata HTCC2501]MDC6353910.1 CBS domain-containing protein [Robiginitalea sp. PM2]MDC6374177.1 CBS domain-containing protein [Robiginitalea sp. SP8]